MKEILNMGIQIDKELIENNVSNAACVAIASALGDKDELIGKAVKAVVSSYVDTEGGTRAEIWQNDIIYCLCRA